MRGWGVILALMIVTGIPSILAAGEDHPCMSGQLALKEGQRAKFEKLLLEHHLEMVDLKAENEKISLRIKMELIGEKPDMGELDKLAESMGKSITKIKKNKFKHLLKLRELLTNDQWRMFLRTHLGKREHHCLGGHSGCCHNEHRSSMCEHYSHTYHKKHCKAEQKEEGCESSRKGESGDKDHECLHHLE